MRFASERLAQRTMERVLDLIVQSIDVNELVKQVDVDTLLSQLDLNTVIEKIDVNSLLRQVDVQALVEQVDVNRLIARIDLDAIVQQTDLGAVIVTSSGSVASTAVDLVRGQAVALDRRINGWVRRLLPLRRPRPSGTAEATERPDEDVKDRGGQGDWIDALGDYAGAASRFAAYAIDVIVSSAAFTLALAGLSFAITIITGRSISWHPGGSIAAGVAFAVWELAYFAYCWATVGKTPGMALLGLRVVRADGADPDPWRGAARALAFPLSIILCGLGFVGVLVPREHRALHDLLAGTAVIYSWDDRAVRLRFMARGRPVSPGRLTRAG
jgi:uncharacterized RDD family membrane protein YckC